MLGFPFFFTGGVETRDKKGFWCNTPWSAINLQKILDFLADAASAEDLSTKFHWKFIDFANLSQVAKCNLHQSFLFLKNDRGINGVILCKLIQLVNKFLNNHLSTRIEPVSFKLWIEPVTIVPRTTHKLMFHGVNRYFKGTRYWIAKQHSKWQWPFV